jgi:hypothetical protein
MYIVAILMSEASKYPEKLKVQFELKDAERIKQFIDLQEAQSRTVSNMGYFCTKEYLDSLKEHKSL